MWHLRCTGRVHQREQMMVEQKKHPKEKLRGRSKERRGRGGEKTD